MRGTAVSVGRTGRLAVLGVAAMALCGAAAARPADAPACTPDGGEPATVTAIGGDLSLTLDDGRVIALSGIDPVRPTAARPQWTDVARGHLAAWLGGHVVLVRPLGLATDRWGRLPAMVFADPEQAADGEGLGRSVALALVADGLARGRPDPWTHACWPAVLAAEQTARRDGLGLWADPYYAIRDAGDLTSFSAIAGSMAIVQGRIAHMGQTRSQIFLDLGPPRTALALRLPRRASFILDQGPIGNTAMVGTLVRARGILDDRGQPRIDIDDADQVERLDGPVPPAGAP